MNSLAFADHLSHFESIREAALQAADPAASVREHLHVSGRRISAGKHALELDEDSRIFLIAFGKAADLMARSAAELLARFPIEGIAAVPKQAGVGPPTNFRYIPAGHPLPDRGSFKAGEAVLSLLGQTREQDLVLALISGGGSAMLELPHAPTTLDELRELNQLLIRSGARIEEINTVRKSISQIKGGGLAQHAYPSRVISLILSDVIGDRLGMVASGPTVLGKVAPEQARAVLRKYGLWEEIPDSVRQVILARPAVRSRSRRPINVLIGNNRKVVRAAAQQAQNLGFRTRIISTQAQGEARDLARSFARSLLASRAGHSLLMGGETTVTVTGDGIGGRNQELALACALALDGHANLAVMCLATDGVDGPTDAAGAIVTGETVPLARRMALSPEAALRRNDSYRFLNQTRSLLRTGPTGTNLNDLIVGLRYAQ